MWCQLWAWPDEVVAEAVEVVAELVAVEVGVVVLVAPAMVHCWAGGLMVAFVLGVDVVGDQDVVGWVAVWVDDAGLVVLVVDAVHVVLVVDVELVVLAGEVEMVVAECPANGCVDAEDRLVDLQVLA